MDVQEFCNLLVDRIEHGVKGTPQEKILDQVFGGTVVNQIICKECIHRSEREEPFFSLGIEIKNQSSIEDGLRVRKFSALNKINKNQPNMFFCSSLSMARPLMGRTSTTAQRVTSE